MVCPQCKQELTTLDEHTFRCHFCGLDYPVRLGIPDLRFPRPGPDSKEASLVERLASHYDTSSYEELLTIYFSSPDFAHFPPEVVARVHEHRLDQLQRGTALSDMFVTRLQAYYSIPDTKQALEVGCGAGAGLVSLAKSYDQVMGLDPDLPELILARKYCEENGLRNVRLVQAYGQFLPFREEQFTYVTAQNVLEHVFEVDEVTAEIARVLTPRGCFTADSRNRYDLLFPEPHVKVRWVGLFPRRWVKHYVRWRTGDDDYETYTRLLSYGDLQGALRPAFGQSWHIVLPGVGAYGFPAGVDTLLTQIKKLTVIE